MASSGGTATSRSIIPRLVRFLSTVHAAKQDKTLTRVAWSTAFSKRYFPKTLTATCVLSFSIGFYGMQNWQRKRQWEWEEQQEKLEREYLRIDMRKKDPAQSSNIWLFNKNCIVVYLRKIFKKSSNVVTRNDSSIWVDTQAKPQKKRDQKRIILLSLGERFGRW